MAGIAGISARGAGDKVLEMLSAIRHRGKAGLIVFENEGTTIGMVWNEAERESVRKYLGAGNVGYDNGPGHYARVTPGKGRFLLCRDELGTAPLFYGNDQDGNLCFASEVKAILKVTPEFHELQPGHFYDNNGPRSFFTLMAGAWSDQDPGALAVRLLKTLDAAVEKCMGSREMGSWLSGGIDSAAVSALAARHTGKLMTFSAGVKDAPDLEYARETSAFIGSEHHEVVVNQDDLVRNLQEVIYHLESFDALLVRSSLTNYLVAKLASDYVPEVFSGEGGDELFAGYSYLKTLDMGSLEKELLKITGVMHNTALQRVDRCASAHGLIAHTIFTDPEVIKFAFTIPVKYKIFNNIEKWILRRSMDGLLPENVLKRPKAKFWEGAGINELMDDYAGKSISDSDFSNERKLPGGLILNTKEELLYYRIFRDHFGTGFDLSWVGRTEGSPVA